MTYLLALDQGTLGSRRIVFNAQVQLVCKHNKNSPNTTGNPVAGACHGCRQCLAQQLYSSQGVASGRWRLCERPADAVSG